MGAHHRRSVVAHRAAHTVHRGLVQRAKRKARVHVARPHARDAMALRTEAIFLAFARLLSSTRPGKIWPSTRTSGSIWWTSCRSTSGRRRRGTVRCCAAELWPGGAFRLKFRGKLALTRDCRGRRVAARGRKLRFGRVRCGRCGGQYRGRHGCASYAWVTMRRSSHGTVRQGPRRRPCCLNSVAVSHTRVCVACRFRRHIRASPWQECATWHRQRNAGDVVRAPGALCL